MVSKLADIWAEGSERNARVRVMVWKLFALLAAIGCLGLVAAEAASTALWRSVDATVVERREECRLLWPEQGEIRERLASDCAEAERLERTSHSHAYTIERTRFIALRWTGADGSEQAVELKRFGLSGDFGGDAEGRTLAIRVQEGEQPLVFRPRSFETLAWLTVGGLFLLWFALPGEWGLDGALQLRGLQVRSGPLRGLRRFIGSWLVYGALAGAVFTLFGGAHFASALRESMSRDLVLATVVETKSVCRLNWRRDKERHFTDTMSCDRAHAIKRSGLAPRLNAVKRPVFVLSYLDASGAPQRVEMRGAPLSRQAMREGDAVLAMATREDSPRLSRTLAEQMRAGEFSFLGIGLILLTVCGTLAWAIGMRRAPSGARRQAETRNAQKAEAETARNVAGAAGEGRPALRPPAAFARRVEAGPLSQPELETAGGAARRGGLGLFG